MLVRLDELCGFMPRAADPDEVVALHDMRIAAKRLRYILEVTGPCFGPYAENGDEAWSRTCRTCSARSTTATCRSPRPRRSPSGCSRTTPRALHAAAGDAADLDPALLKQAPHARDHAGRRRAAGAPARPPAGALRPLPRAVGRLRAQGLPRAAGVRGRRTRRCPRRLTALASSGRDGSRAARRPAERRAGPRPIPRSTSTASCRGSTSTTACCSSPRTTRSRCSSG